MAIDDLFRHPHRHYKTIHVAGTNGKGSVSNMLAAILQKAGYKTGLFTSPHLKDFRERIRVNGKMIPKKFICGFVENNKKEFEKIKPSFFEWTTGLAFHYFREKKVDVAVIETGLGGRLDSTNIITPVLSVITNIGYDHMNLLGNTLEKIAYEKAGIIKKNTPVAVGESNAAINHVFKKRAHEMNASLFITDKNFKATLIKDESLTKSKLALNIYKQGKLFYKDLVLDLTGHYQLKNVCTVLQCCEILKNSFKISEPVLRSALSDVHKVTGLSGRWQVISKKPLTICDTGHNEDGIKNVLTQLKKYKFKELHFIFGIVNDKDADRILSLLPKKATYYFCKANIPRGMDAMELAARAAKFNLKGGIYPSVKMALREAQRNTRKDSLVFVGGSTFTVAEVLN